MRTLSFLIPPMLLPLMLLSNAGQAQTLRWRTMRADGTAAQDQIRNAGPRKNPLRSHYLMQFAQTISSEQLQTLAPLGIETLGYVPDNGLTVSAPDGADFSALGLQWYGHLLPQEKMSPRLSTQQPTNAPVWVIIEFFSDVPKADASDIAVSSGLTLRGQANLLANHLLALGTPEQLQNLALWDEVEYIFPASPNLVFGAVVYACAGAETTMGTVPQSVPTIGEGWDGPGLGSASLDYAFYNTSAQLPADSVQSEIARAFAVWNGVVDVSFTPSTNTGADQTIAIKFATYAHGDAYPFDGPGGVLAHTFYPAPPNPEPIAGDMHFNDSESWHIGADVDLFSVALHETGHALGLGHSDDPSDVMYPYYKQVTALNSGDIQAILTLYAAQPAPSPGPSPSPSPAPVSPAGPAPTIVIQLPVSAAAYTTTAATVTLAGTAYDAAGVASVTWNNSTGGSGTAIGGSAWTAGPIVLQSGLNLLSATVHGQDGQTQTAQLQVTYTASPVSSTPDTTPPTLQIVSPASTEVYTSASSIVISGTASDNVAVASVSWSSSTLGAAENPANGTTQWSTPPIPLINGLNVITITAKDGAGNSSWRVVQVTQQ